DRTTGPFLLHESVSHSPVAGGREGEAPAEPQPPGSAGASPSRPLHPIAKRSNEYSLLIPKDLSLASDKKGPLTPSRKKRTSPERLFLSSCQQADGNDEQRLTGAERAVNVSSPVQALPSFFH